MEPNDLLKELRQSFLKIQQRIEACREEDKTRPEDVVYMVELAITASEKFKELDGLATTGFLPDEWSVPD